MNYHARNASNEGGVSDAVVGCKRAYDKAIELHMSQKFRMFFRILDEDNDRSYCDTELHSDLCDVLEKYKKDPQRGLYYWWTINLPTENPDKDQVLALMDMVIMFHSQDIYFEGPFAARLELHTGEGKHLHCHIMSRIGHHQCSDIKKHMITKKVADYFHAPRNAIHSGDAKGVLLHKKLDKLPYLNGEKVDSKSESVKDDAYWFACKNICQYFSVDMDEGSLGLVDPDIEEERETDPTDWDTQPYPDPLQLAVDSTETAQFYQDAVWEADAQEDDI